MIRPTLEDLHRWLVAADEHEGRGRFTVLARWMSSAVEACSEDGFLARPLGPEERFAVRVAANIQRRHLDVALGWRGENDDLPDVLTFHERAG